MSQLRLAVDSKIMADRIGQGRAGFASANEVFSLESLARSTELELKRLASEEGIETRVLIDEGPTGKLKGSAYWIESALLALINASLTFTDQGFIELSLWTEVSISEEPELLARIRDSGVKWSLDDQSLDHPSLTTLRIILDGVGAVICSSPVSTTGGQEHVVRFKSN
jgi:signal transduction histidine kinase